MARSRFTIPLPSAIVRVVLAATLTSWSVGALADFPEKPVKIIHAYPGAPVDAAVRLMADRLSQVWKQPVLVDTRPGASEIIAGDAVAKAAPDGYTLFVGSEANFTNNQYLFSKLPFDPERDLVPITELYEVPFCVIVPTELPVRTLQEFVGLMQNKGSAYMYASTGAGGPNHVAMEGLRRSLRFEMTHVPYKVGPQLMQDLIAGRVSALVAGVYTAAPHVESGRLRVLAVSGAQRQKVLPQTPTFAEAGYPGVDLRTFVGLAAPRGTPAAVVAKIHKDVEIILKSDEFQKKVGDPFGYVPVGSDPGKFGAFLKTKRASAKAQIEELHLKID
ncbi:Bug family tripartite tricarboxylate transporter substrate binding protein [Variovorax boronicumulans]|uniref:Bug family tripartite tricarboxylate transporter substrate binding protein n=1 Tax=Variovorax boronicumulans TaxID=436515 RepID=UPI0036F3C920